MFGGFFIGYMVELVDTPVLGTGPFGGESSSLSMVTDASVVKLVNTTSSKGVKLPFRVRPEVQMASWWNW